MSGDKVFINVFPKSGTGMIRSFRGISGHVGMFDGHGDFKTSDRYLSEIIHYGECTGHVPYREEIYKVLKHDGFRIVFVFRNLRDAALSLTSYVIHREHSELNVMTGGFRLSRTPDQLLAAIDVVAEWWELFSEWMNKADALYTYRELRGAAFLLGRENDSETFAHGNINSWVREFQPVHLQAAKKLPDVLRDYNFIGYYDETERDNQNV